MFGSCRPDQVSSSRQGVDFGQERDFGRLYGRELALVGSGPMHAVFEAVLRKNCGITVSKAKEADKEGTFWGAFQSPLSDHMHLLTCLCIGRVESSAARLQSELHMGDQCLWRVLLATYRVMQAS